MLLVHLEGLGEVKYLDNRRKYRTSGEICNNFDTTTEYSRNGNKINKNAITHFSFNLLILFRM